MDQKIDFISLQVEILKKTQGNQLLVMGHSLGAIEALDFTKGILKIKDSEGLLSIDLIFISPPGIKGEGLTSIAELMKKISFLVNPDLVAMKEQHVFYPLPKAFYEKTKDIIHRYQLISFSEEKRQSRRKWFEKEIIHNLERDPKKRERILMMIRAIDDKIINDNSLSPTNKDQLLQNRAKIISPYLQEVFQGKHRPESLHQEILVCYEELNLKQKSLKQWLFYLANLIIYIGKTFEFTYKNTRTSLEELLGLAQKKNSNLRVVLVSSENDVIVTPSELESLVDDLSSLVSNYFLFESAAHSSIGYEPSFLTKLISRLISRPS
ncbi:MAG: hypothetical protein NZL96_02800 [Patescibacteria group bacterium]|nr:hypothetical protein [Patescibacteria group bacterium]